MNTLIRSLLISLIALFFVACGNFDRRRGDRLDLDVAAEERFKAAGSMRHIEERSWSLEKCRPSTRRAPRARVTALR